MIDSITLANIYKDYDSGYSFQMLRDKYKRTVVELYNLIYIRIKANG